MDIESKLKNKSILDIEVSFDDLVENYAPQLISAIKRYLSVLDELPKIANHIDEVISTIRNSNTPEEAKVKLIKLLGISSYTAKCVLNMPLGKLTGLRKEDLIEEKSQLLAQGGLSVAGGCRCLTKDGNTSIEKEGYIPYPLQA